MKVSPKDVTMHFDVHQGTWIVCISDTFGLRNEVAWFVYEGHANEFVSWLTSGENYVRSMDEPGSREGKASEKAEKEIPLAGGSGLSKKA